MRSICWKNRTIKQIKYKSRVILKIDFILNKKDPVLFITGSFLFNKIVIMYLNILTIKIKSNKMNLNSYSFYS